MPEPAYISENGTPIPYVPIEVKTARDAYAASLHVLFKHVADFHICIVRAFSTKYGIPEDEILQTIQESEEFKNMKVDPVLDTDQLDTLGYLKSTPTPVPEPTKEALPPPVKKSVVAKTKKVIPAVVEPVTEPIVNERHDSMMPSANVVDAQEPIKPKTIRKKVVQKPTTNTAVNLFDMDACATNVIAANTNGTLEAQFVDTTPIMAELEPIKTKTIRKKVVQKPAATEATEATNAVAPATNTDAPRKIIRKKTSNAVV